MKLRFLIAAATLVAATASAAEPQRKALAETGVDKIHSFYMNTIKRLSASGAAVQDIEMACSGEIFLEWFNQYSGIIGRTEGLRYAEISGYKEAEQKAFLVENDRKVYDMIRADVSHKILAEIDVRRGKGTWPSGPATIALDNVQDQTLLGNLAACRDENFVTAIRNTYGPIDEIGSRQVTIRIDGFTPRLANGEPPRRVMPIYNGIGSSSKQYTATYEEWLFEILTR